MFNTHILPYWCNNLYLYVHVPVRVCVCVGVCVCCWKIRDISETPNRPELHTVRPQVHSEP